MPSLDKRVTKLETTVEDHLIESGEIRGDLKWLKRGYWGLVGLGVTFSGAAITAAVELIVKAGK